MALHEISIDYNIVDVAFSKSGTKIAILTTRGFALYTWTLKNTPAPEAKLSFFHSFSQPACRPRQIAFIAEDDIYVLMHDDFGQEKVERIDYQTKEETVAFVPEISCHISSIFPDLELNALWIAQIVQHQKARSYSFISEDTTGIASAIPWPESPGNETSWASPVKLANEAVSTALL